MMAAKPIKNCYWVVPSKLLAGEYPRNPDDESSPAKVGALIGAGISAFIDLTVENEHDLRPYSHLIGTASHQRFPITDVSLPRSKAETASILDAIDEHVKQVRTVYVHCWGGSGRTGVIVGCWLARHGLGGEAALIRLRELWKECGKSSPTRGTPDTRAQEEYIRGWEEGR
jgi:protein-tyrosine phosphatase